MMYALKIYTLRGTLLMRNIHMESMGPICSPYLFYFIAKFIIFLQYIPNLFNKIQYYCWLLLQFYF